MTVDKSSRVEEIRRIMLEVDPFHYSHLNSSLPDEEIYLFQANVLVEQIGPFYRLSKVRLAKAIQEAFKLEDSKLNPIKLKEIFNKLISFTEIVPFEYDVLKRKICKDDILKINDDVLNCDIFTLSNLKITYNYFGNFLLNDKIYYKSPSINKVFETIIYIIKNCVVLEYQKPHAFSCKEYSPDLKTCFYLADKSLYNQGFIKPKTKDNILKIYM